MENLKVDLSKIRNELSGSPRLKYNKKKKTALYIVVFLIIIFLSLTIKIIFSHDGGLDSDTSFWGQIKGLILSGNKTLDGADQDRINILLLGQGGIGHDGPYLTDTIILASIKPSTKQVAMISIPRDLVMPIPGYGWRRINYANAAGEEKNPGHGADLAIETISKTFDLPIQYYVRIDFAAFTGFIDDLGGVKVYIDNSFTDNLYPTDNYQYKTISFNKGWQVMDGETALEFARSRHGNKGEGSDFARGVRQQKIILAAKDKLLSFQTLSNPWQIKTMLEKFNSHVTTNLSVSEIVQLAKITHGVDANAIIDKSLDGKYLEDVVGDDGAFLLQPPGGNFTAIREMVSNIFDTATNTLTNSNTNGTNDQNSLLNTKASTNANSDLNSNHPTKEEVKTVTKPTTPEQNPTIRILNGTFVSGLASKTGAEISALGFNRVATGNAPFRDYTETTIYNLTPDKTDEAIKIIAKKLDAIVATIIPAWAKNYSDDLIVVLGQK